MKRRLNLSFEDIAKVQITLNKYEINNDLRRHSFASHNRGIIKHFMITMMMFAQHPIRGGRKLLMRELCVNDNDDETNEEENDGEANEEDNDSEINEEENEQDEKDD